LQEEAARDGEPAPFVEGLIGGRRPRSLKIPALVHQSKKGALTFMAAFRFNSGAAILIKLIA
jgi:hypothetical protein